MKVLFVGGPIHGESQEMADPPQTYEAQQVLSGDRVRYAQRRWVETGVGNLPMQLEMVIFVADTVEEDDLSSLMQDALELSDS